MAKLSEFEKAFSKARGLGEREFEFRGKRYSTKRADRPDEELTASMTKTKRAQMASPSGAEVKASPRFDPSETEEGLSSVDTGSFLEDVSENVKKYSPAAAAGIAGIAALAGGIKGMMKKGAKKLGEKDELLESILELEAKKTKEAYLPVVRRPSRHAETPPAVVRKPVRGTESNEPGYRTLSPKEVKQEMDSFREAQKEAREMRDALETMAGEGGRNFKRGGMVKKATKSSYKSGGSVGTASRRADGIAKKGHTRGKIY